MNRSEKKKVVNKAPAKAVKKEVRALAKEVRKDLHPRPPRSKAAKQQVRKQNTGRTQYMKGADPERIAMAGTKFHGAASQIASIIMLPGAYAGRLPIMSSEPSACVPLKRTDDLPGNTTGVTVGAPDLPASELCALKFKDSALRSLLLWNGKTSAAPVYFGVWNQAGVLVTNPQYTMFVNKEYDVTPLCYKFSSGDKVHGDQLYLGRASDGKRYTLMSGSKDGVTANSNFVFNWTPVVPANQQLLVRLLRTNGDTPAIVLETTMATGSGTVTLNVPKTGGYAVTATLQPAGGTPSTANLVTNWSLAINCCSAPGASCWGQKALTGLEARLATTDEYVIHGSDLTITQAASVTNENGRVLQVALPPQTPIESTMTLSFADLGKINSRRYTSRNLKKGCDGFVYPGGISDFDFQSDFDTDSGGVLSSATYDWVPKEPFIQFSLYVPTSAGQVFSYTTGDAVEWLTPDPWTQLGSRRIGKNRILNDVVEQIGNLPHFFDNEDHEKDILSMLGPLAITALTGALLL